MRVGVCDDDKRERELIKDICRVTMESLGKGYEIAEFQDGEEVLLYQGELDVLILDIEMPSLDGIALKNELQKRNSATMIIYVSSHDELVMDAFGMHVIGFVKKTLVREKLAEMLKTAIKLRKPYVLIDERINSRDVCYIEADYSYSRLVCNGEKQYLLRMSMDSLETMLSAYQFIRVHRKYLVNMEYVDRIREQKVAVREKMIPISTRLRSKAKKAYDGYARGNARFY